MPEIISMRINHGISPCWRPPGLSHLRFLLENVNVWVDLNSNEKTSKVFFASWKIPLRWFSTQHLQVWFPRHVWFLRVKFYTMWGRSDVCWFINPSNYSYWSYKPTWLSLGPHFVGLLKVMVLMHFSNPEALAFCSQPWPKHDVSQQPSWKMTANQTVGYSASTDSTWFNI